MQLSRHSVLVGSILGLAALAGSLAPLACQPEERNIIIDDGVGGEGGSSLTTGGSSGGDGDGDGDGTGGGDGDGDGDGDGTGGGGVGTTCETHVDCNPENAPICDGVDAECRPCTSSDECLAAHPSTPFCDGPPDEMFCVACIGDSDCTDPAASICSGGTCTGCAKDDDCASLACDVDGTCVPEANIVYALAETGDPDLSQCGTRALPCRFMDSAFNLLSAFRSHLVLVPTVATFSEDTVMTVPAGAEYSVHGHGVAAVTSVAGMFAQGGGGSLRLVDVVAKGRGDPTGDAQVLVSCAGDGGDKLFVSGSEFSGASTAIYTESCTVTVETSRFVEIYGSSISVNCGDLVSCEEAGGARIERNYFSGPAIGNDSSDTVSLAVPGTVVVNNVFSQVAITNWSTGIFLRSSEVVVAYNTFYESGNCGYNGLISCLYAEDAVVSSNITALSTTLSVGGPCYDQVYTSDCQISHTVSEQTQTGLGNAEEDPSFVDGPGGDYHLNADSSALDLGDPALAPAVDFDGNPRPGGSAPDAGAFERQ